MMLQNKIQKNNPNYPQIPNHPYRILIVYSFVSGKTNSLFHLISQQPDIDKIYLNVNDPHKAKYQCLIKKRENTDSKHLNGSKAFIGYSIDTNDVYENIEEYNPNKTHKILIIFDDMITDTLNNKKLNPIVIEFIIRGGKLNISLVFIT